MKRVNDMLSKLELRITELERKADVAYGRRAHIEVLLSLMEDGVRFDKHTNTVYLEGDEEPDIFDGYYGMEPDARRVKRGWVVVWTDQDCTAHRITTLGELRRLREIL